MNDFILGYWLDGDKYPGIPSRVDTYQPGHIKWGSDPKRGRAMQHSRAKKQRIANLAFFVVNVLPLLPPDIARNASLDYGRETDDFSHAKARGWQYWRKGEAASWVHETDIDLVEKAKALGACPE